MYLDHFILTLIVAVPLAGAIVLALLPDRAPVQRMVALLTTVLTFLCTLHLPAHYAQTSATGSFRFVQDLPWIAAPVIRYHVGVDGL